MTVISAHSKKPIYLSFDLWVPGQLAADSGLIPHVSAFRWKRIIPVGISFPYPTVSAVYQSFAILSPGYLSPRLSSFSLSGMVGSVTTIALSSHSPSVFSPYYVLILTRHIATYGRYAWLHNNRINLHMSICGHFYSLRAPYIALF
jgi:hypothetical protein